ncbi:uncharacterized protein LOC114544109 [Dendronephthya gigantea]|uniref:uncharacterized protein LOC114544109 n=1 Tax=Dendronephthya gigantea TaxID=151771 RepID=UPI00106A90C4|nr:uncharacterized protein LOC114544109 [Dendronephthya gigantea]
MVSDSSHKMSYIPCGIIILAAYVNVFATAGGSNCPSNGWYRVKCSCFIVKTSTEDLNWNKAEERCSRMNKANLASIKSQHQNEILGEHLSGKKSWIGLRSDGNSSILLKNGEKATFLRGVKTRYDQSRCIASRLTNNIWLGGKCGQKRRYICSRKPVGNESCREGWRPHRNSCYALAIKPLAYNEAEQNCIRINSTLVEISTKQEYEFLRKRLHTGDEIIEVWIGLQNETSANNFDTLGGHVITETRSKNCVRMELAKTSVIWEAKKCNATLKSYVCETRNIELDFKVNVTNVNETSAKISWSTHPHECLLSSDEEYKLEIHEETKLKYSMKITLPESSQIVGDFKPKTKYQIKVARNNKTMAVKNFSTSKIENPLHVLAKISSQEIHAKEGDTVNLLCAVTGEPPIRFSWIKDKNMMKSYVETKNPQQSSILSVVLKNQTHFGTYICHIKDQFGNKTHAIKVIPLSEDDQSENNLFVIVIVILGIAVAILLVIMAYCIRSIRRLRRRLEETKKTSPVTLRNVSKEGLTYDKPQPSPGKTSIDVRYVSPEEENEAYTALRRNGDEEENFYSPLKDAPLYVNANEFK